jgi:hypothetical protein
MLTLNKDTSFDFLNPDVSTVPFFMYLGMENGQHRYIRYNSLAQALRSQMYMSTTHKGETSSLGLKIATKEAHLSPDQLRTARGLIYLQPFTQFDSVEIQKPVNQQAIAEDVLTCMLTQNPVLLAQFLSNNFDPKNFEIQISGIDFALVIKNVREKLKNFGAEIPVSVGLSAATYNAIEGYQKDYYISTSGTITVAELDRIRNYHNLQAVILVRNMQLRWG